jgi:protein-S-isoprenylcysteine O-methyltransferase Ste14
MSTDGSMGKGKRPLLLRALGRLIYGAVILGLALFLTAGTVHYWQAWVYLSILFGLVTAGMIYLYVRDPDLLERRMKAKEKERAQKRLRALFTPVLLAIWIVPGLDARWGWSSVPAAVVVLADAAFLLGYLFFFRVLKANSYGARTVEVEQGQAVITTGPYAIVRHPMYSAILLIYLASPPALGSYWALLVVLPLPFVLALRIRNEEEVLVRDLPGYEAYRQRTKYRLVPYVW